MTTLEGISFRQPAVHDYPKGSADLPLSPHDLAADVAAHPEAYDSELVTNHIEPFIGKYGLGLVVDESGLIRAEYVRTTNDIRGILGGRKEGFLLEQDAHKLIDAGQGRDLARNLDKFIGLDHVEIAHKLIDTGWGYAVVENLDKFTGLDHVEIAYKLIDTDQGYTVAENLDKFTGLDHVEIAYKLIDTDQGYTVARNIDKFTGLDHVEIAHKLIDAGRGYAVAEYLDKFTGLDHTEIAHKLIDAGRGYAVAEYLDKFTGLDAEIAHKLIDAGRGYAVAEYLDKFTGLDHTEIAHKLIDAGRGYTVAEYLDKFTGTNRSEIIGKLASTNVQSLTGLPMDFDSRAEDIDPQYLIIEVPQIISQESNAGSEQGFIRYLEMCGNVTTPELRTTKDVFGSVSLFGARLVYNIFDMDAGLLPELQDIGVSSHGQEGVEQLRLAISDFRQEFQQGDLSRSTEQKLEKNGLLRKLLMDLTGYQESYWGGHSDGGLTNKISYYNRAFEDGRIAPLGKKYEASEVYDVTKIGAKSDTLEYTPDVIERYGALHLDLVQAAGFSADSGGIGRALDKLVAAIRQVEQNLGEQIQAVDPSEENAERKIEHLTKRKTALDSYLQGVETEGSAARQLVAPAKFTRGFATLEQYKELHSPMRQLVFAWSMRKYPAQRGVIANLEERPTEKAVSATREFIEHIVNQETYGEYFAGNKKLANRFKQLSSTRALEEAMKLHQLRAKRGGKTSLQFVPTRGVMMEMSGQIADACWADKYRSIAETFPNFTAVMIKARPGEKTERIVGAAMLIETTDTETGEKVLLLRGLNPTENYINRVDVAEFYEAATAYVAQQAAVVGAKPAIVIDDHTAGSGTNRPMLFGYMYSERNRMARVPVDDGSTEFNGYDVTRDSYLIEPVG